MQYTLPLLLWVLGGTGCSIENPLFEIDGDASRGSSGLVTTGAPTSSTTLEPTATTNAASSGSNPDGLTTSGGSTTGGDATTAPGTGTEPAASTSTTPGTSTEPGTSTGDVPGTTSTSGGESTGGGVKECLEGVVGEPPRLAIKKDGQVLMACGGATTLSNAFAKFSGATLQIYDSGACTKSGTLYEVTGVNFAITPMGFGDNCSEVTIEWAAVAPCEVTGFALANGGNASYVGAFGRTTGPSEYTAFSVEPVHECGCAVDGVACCQHVFELDQTLYPPGGYALGFPGAAAPIAVQETTDGEVDGASYLFTNLRSFVHESCMLTPSHVWLDLRWWAMSNN